MKATKFSWYILIISLAIFRCLVSAQTDNRNQVCEKTPHIQIYDSSFFEEMRQFYAKLHADNTSQNVKSDSDQLIEFAEHFS